MILEDLTFTPHKNQDLDKIFEFNRFDIPMIPLMQSQLSSINAVKHFILGTDDNSWLLKANEQTLQYLMDMKNNGN